ncbi:MAG: hypothetical protein OSA98_04330 [Rubripirellula sp.]|jgi:hypothetical protein|nr:hypothetical protein [Rubripirellula sp.]|tara:strand:+ start:526 stop:759 length:234 start_codon:yes stop_codon:yes gene_type:complete
MDSNTLSPPSIEDVSVEDCEAVLICLNSRRFVVARPGEPRDLWPLGGGWDKLRQLKPGDEVIYKGHLTTVRAVDVYR